MKIPTVADRPIWAIAQGLVEEPLRGPFLPLPHLPPPSDWDGDGESLRRSIPHGAVYGPMTLAEAQEFASLLRLGTVTLCIIPSCGIQAMQLSTLAWRKVNEALGPRPQLPGMTYFPNCDGRNVSTGGILLIGNGPPFLDLQTADFAISSSPNIAFPVGLPDAKPLQHRRGEDLRHSHKWASPDFTTLDDLAPLAAFLGELTEKDWAAFRAAEIVREVQDQKEIKEVEAWWKAKREAEAIAPPTIRKRLP